MSMREARVPSELRDHVILVTGGTRGIGEGIVRLLASAGARLVVTGRKPEGLARIAAELDAQGVEHLTEAADVADRDAAFALVERAAERFGRIDGLVANAQSMISVRPLLEIDERRFDVLLSTGPKGTLWWMQAVVPHMERQGRGRIVTFGSTLGLTGLPKYGPYAAAKEAVRSLTRTAANEWGRLGITVNCVLPASTAHRLPPDDEARRRAWASMFDDHPLGRDGDPVHDIAPTVAFLLSDASQYVTGQTLMVDGGGVMRA